jgi:hypothetical protein
MATPSDQFETASTDDSFLNAARGEQSAPASAKRKVWPLLAGTSAVVLLGAAGSLWLGSRNALPQVSPLEPTPINGALTVPIDPSLGKQAAPNALATAAVAVASGASTAADAVADTFTTLRTSLNLVTGRVEVLEASDQKQNAAIAALRVDVDKVNTDHAAAAEMAASAASAAVAVARPAAPRRVAVVRRAIAAPKAVAAAPAILVMPARASNISDASLLAVDTWGGKPSVAVAKTGSAGGFDVRFLNEGETQGSVTLKRADVGTQRATFSTPGGDLTLAPKEQ